MDSKIDVFINTISRVYQGINEEQKERLKMEIQNWLRSTFEVDLSEKVKRYISIPSIGPIPTVEKFVQLIHEVIQLYTNGLFYSTVALCGITAERLCYDLIENSKISINGQILSSSQKESLYRLNQVVLVDMLFRWGLIKEETRGKLDEIRKIRNRYAHPSELSAQEPQKDSIKMLDLLCQVINTEYGPGLGARYTMEGGKIKRQY